MWSLQLITAPVKEPLDISLDVRSHSRLGEAPDSEDRLLGGMVSAARHACETFTGRQLIDATLELWLDSWLEPGIASSMGDVLFMPRPPLRSIVSIKYLDTAGALQTWASTEYSKEVQAIGVVAPTCQRGRVYPNYGVIWPDLRCQPGAVKIQFTAGYGADGTKVPEPLKQGMLLMVGEMYERRELSVVGSTVTPAMVTAEALWWPYRAY